MSLSRQKWFRSRGWCGIGVCLLMMTGCHGGLTVPQGWHEQPVQPSPLGVRVTPSSLTDGSDETGRLQVIICYGRVLSNHTALRLVCPGEHVLFWDPGGYFGEKDASTGRRRDLILLKPPTLDQWWHYRRVGCGEPFMLVFEWDLPPALAISMHHALRHGHEASDPAEGFHSDAPGLFCCIAVCDFLQRFASRVVTVPKRWLMPHDLGRHLWSQSPNRVHLFRDGSVPTVLVPDALTPTVADSSGNAEGRQKHAVGSSFHQTP